MGSLKPFFSRYGSKWRIARYYPAPQHFTILEPFAGSAGYSLHYPHHRIRLYDRDEIICGTWDYLIHVTPDEIRRLPVNIEHLDDHNLTMEQKWLIGFWMHKAADWPSRIPSQWMLQYPNDSLYWKEVIRERIAQQVPCIRHWTIEQRSYDQIPDMEATWFIDAPYDNEAGEHYTYGRRSIDYQHLAGWCRSRSGQVIVCENQGADWLDFRPFRIINGQRKQSTEVLWTNEEAPHNLERTVDSYTPPGFEAARVVNQEFVSWARTDSGPKFHAGLLDAPYGLHFLNAKWDDPKQMTKSQVVRYLPSGQRMTTVEENIEFQDAVRQWGEAMLSHLFPGALVMMFAAPRMFEWVATGMQMAGFEHWDTIMWIHSQGLPKAQDIGGMVAKATGIAGQWQGYKTPALKPAYEPILCFRAPRQGMTYAELARKYGSGCLNVDGGRIGTGAKKWDTPKGGIWHLSESGGQRLIDNPLGRYPANLILDEESAIMVEAQKFGASRFFYVAKASKKERNAGCEDLLNDHPTIKPLALCCYLAKLLLPPASVSPRRLLVPFSGSGSEMIGGVQAGWDEVVGIEQNPHYCEIANRRIEYWRMASQNYDGFYLRDHRAEMMR